MIQGFAGRDRVAALGLRLVVGHVGPVLLGAA